MRAALPALLFLAAALGAPRPTGAQGDGPAGLERFTALLEARVPALMDRYGLPGVGIALIREGEPVWSKAWGHADLATGRPMTTDTYGRAESVSKSVTAWGVMTLVETGAVALDSPVRGYLESWRLPETPFDEAGVTPRLLLANAAGMPLGTIGVRYDPRGPVPALRDHMAGEAVLRRAPGERFEYSNAGFNVLEILVEDVTGEPFADYMDRAVLGPLGMDGASFSWSDAFAPPVATGYDPAGNPVPVYIYPDRAAGGLFATLHDLAAFAAAGMRAGDALPGRGILEPSTVEIMYSPTIGMGGFFSAAFDAYGLGHFIETLPDGRTAVAHGGQGSGWMTHFHAVPETGDGIVMMVNSQRAWPFFAHVLGDWADWIGADGIGMEAILKATMGLRILVALLLATVLLQAARLVRGVATGQRRLALRGRSRPELAPGRQSRKPLRAAQALAGVGVAAAVVWTASRPYSFLTALFPTLVGWLGWTLAALAAVLLASAIVPPARGPEAAP